MTLDMKIYGLAKGEDVYTTRMTLFETIKERTTPGFCWAMDETILLLSLCVPFLQRRDLALFFFFVFVFS